MGAFFVIAWPLSKLLDCVLGKDHSTFYRRAQLKVSYLCWFMTDKSILPKFNNNHGHYAVLKCMYCVDQKKTVGQRMSFEDLIW